VADAAHAFAGLVHLVCRLPHEPAQELDVRCELDERPLDRLAVQANNLVNQ
jgi:hypothetical protein